MTTAADLLPEFRVLFPEFNSISDALVTTYLTIALSIFSKCTDATLWLAAFLLDEKTQADAGGGSGGSGSGAGQILKMQVDSKMVQFSQAAPASGNPADQQYMSNVYGKNYLRLKAACLGYLLAGGVYGNGC